MKAENELNEKYPANIKETYFPKGFTFNWNQEYFDIVWQFPIISLVILELFRLGKVITSIDVMITDDLFSTSTQASFTYEGSSWSLGNPSGLLPKEILTNPQFSANAISLDALSYLMRFTNSNIETLSSYYFKLSF